MPIFHATMLKVLPLLYGLLFVLAGCGGVSSYPVDEQAFPQLTPTPSVGNSTLHDHRDMPFILAGGGLPGGRFLDYRNANNGEGESHAKLLVSIANRMAVPIEQFGYSGHGLGPLAEL